MNTTPSPLEYLAAFAITFVAGALATGALRLMHSRARRHGDLSHDA